MAVVVHFDVDAFYVAVERLDDASLIGKPVVVQQFNSGGFVAVSYEAKAAGIRKGDGVGAGGRRNIARLAGHLSLDEARHRCPELQVKPMRTDRYRAIGTQIKALLVRRVRGAGGIVQKSSYDDFYLDATSLCTNDMFTQTLVVPSNLPVAHAVGDAKSLLCADLQRGAFLGAALQAQLKAELGLDVSVGVARTKVLAKHAGGIGRPRALSVVPDEVADSILAAMDISNVASLQGKLGDELRQLFAVRTVGDLRAVPLDELVRVCGVARARTLQQLCNGEETSCVQDKGDAQLSLLAERSFPPTDDDAAVKRILGVVCEALAERISNDVAEFGRQPAKLSTSWRRGYHSFDELAIEVAHGVADGNMRSKSVPFPPSALHFLVSCANFHRDGTRTRAMAVELAAAAWRALAAAAKRPFQLTRVAVSAQYDSRASTTVDERRGLQRFLAPRSSAVPSGKCDRRCQEFIDRSDSVSAAVLAGHNERRMSQAAAEREGDVIAVDVAAEHSVDGDVSDPTVVGHGAVCDGGAHRVAVACEAQQEPASRSSLLAAGGSCTSRNVHACGGEIVVLDCDAEQETAPAASEGVNRGEATSQLSGRSFDGLKMVVVDCDAEQETESVGSVATSATVPAQTRQPASIASYKPSASSWSSEVGAAHVRSQHAIRPSESSRATAAPRTPNKEGPQSDSPSGAKRRSPLSTPSRKRRTVQQGLELYFAPPSEETVQRPTVQNRRTDVQHVQCPVCNRQVALHRINQHLDQSCQ